MTKSGKATAADVAARVREIIESYTPLGTVVQDDSTVEALGLDSLDVVSIQIEIDKATGIEVPDAEAEKWKTVGDVVRSATKGLS